MKKTFKLFFFFCAVLIVPNLCQAIGEPAPPILSSPASNANVAGTSANLSWSTSPGATQYWLWVRRTSDNVVVINQNIGNKTSYTLTSLTNNGDNYYWMVRAGSNSGWSGWTAARRFFNGPALCTYSISSTSGSFASSGGTSLISVTAPTSSCTWTASETLSWVSLSSTTGTGTGAISVTVDANTGAERSGSIIIAGKTYTISQAAPGPSLKCGAYVAPNLWKQFDCYNLAAIGKTTNDDPFTPSWRLNGGYWQWGRKGPSSSQWYNTNTANFAHGPTDSGVTEVNSASISGWAQTSAPKGSWSDAAKTANDPCPAGYRVPTQSQWAGVINNSTQSIVGTWSTDADNHTNYSSARFFGDALMLPAAGYRSNTDGSLYYRGYDGLYWASMESTSSHAWGLYFRSSYADTNYHYRQDGFSVRCIAE